VGGRGLQADVILERKCQKEKENMKKILNKNKEERKEKGIFSKKG
jgi:hypothetical protein